MVLARRQAVCRPTLVGRRSDSTVRVPVCLGRSPDGHLHDAEYLAVAAHRVQWVSSTVAKVSWLPVL